MPLKMKVFDVTFTLTVMRQRSKNLIIKGFPVTFSLTLPLIDLDGGGAALATALALRRQGIADLPLSLPDLQHAADQFPVGGEMGGDFPQGRLAVIQEKILQFNQCHDGNSLLPDTPVPTIGSGPGRLGLTWQGGWWRCAETSRWVVSFRAAADQRMPVTRVWAVRWARAPMRALPNRGAIWEARPARAACAGTQPLADIIVSSRSPS